MFRLDLTYEDFDGDQVTEQIWFGLTKTELVELEVQYKEGLKETIERIVKTNDKEQLVAEFKKIILLSYGIKSDDGKRFIKNVRLREEFSQTAAYDYLFMKLATDEKAASEFINGIVPKGFAIDVEKAKQESTVAVIPRTPPG